MKRILNVFQFLGVVINVGVNGLFWAIFGHSRHSIRLRIFILGNHIIKPVDKCVPWVFLRYFVNIFVKIKFINFIRRWNLRLYLTKTRNWIYIACGKIVIWLILEVWVFVLRKCTICRGFVIVSDCRFIAWILLWWVSVVIDFRILSRILTADSCRWIFTVGVVIFQRPFLKWIIFQDLIYVCILSLDPWHVFGVKLSLPWLA